ncbi:MAG: hypothetical protein Q9207_005723 [Kuettlingeria erythrocarpa]
MKERAHLLLLPREIRDQIYETLLDLDVPPKPSSTSSTLKQLTPSLFVPERIPRPPSAALLNCNRQLRSEVSQHLSRRSLTYSLDLLLLTFANVDPNARRRVIPEWTTIPALPLVRAKCIHITLQAQQWAEYRPRVSSDHAEAERMTLFPLLGRLFAYGPTFVVADHLRFFPPPVSVEELAFTGGADGRSGSGVWAPLEGRLGRITLRRLGGEVVRRWSVEEDQGVSAEEWERLGWVF